MHQIAEQRRGAAAVPLGQQARPATPTRVPLVCEVTDRTTNGGGVPIPVKELPAGWPYDGPQPPALLDLRKVGGRWLVHADHTGQAG